METKIKSIIDGKEGILLSSSGWNWKDIQWEDGTIESDVAGWTLELAQ